MASSAIEEAGATDSGRSQRRKLHKAFNHLKSHAAAVANFTLQWQDLEDYILSVQDQIESRLTQLQSQAAAQLPSDGYTEGKSLLWHLIGLKYRKTIRGDVRHALVGLENRGAVVVEAVREYLHLRNEGAFKYVTTARRSCTELLLEFMRGETQIEEQVRDDARRLVVEWKEKLEKSESNMFLKYLQAYGLVDEIHKDNIFKIFQDVLNHKDAPKMLRSLGLGHRASNVIKKLLSLKKGFVAVNFVYEFELVNEFSPASIIKEHLDYMTNEASGLHTEDSAEAVNLELTALCAAMKCIETHNLESQFPIEDLDRRIIQLKQRKYNSQPSYTIGKLIPKIIRNGGHNALVGLENCGAAGIEAVREYLYLRENRNGEVASDLRSARRSRAEVLQKLMRVEPRIGKQVREDARRLVVEWKEKRQKIEAHMFLKYLQAYGLLDEFHEDQIFEIFQDLLHHKEAPEMLRSLGLGHRAADFIKKFISLKKGIEAVKFVFSFELVNEFSPASLIKEHLDYMKEEAAKARRSGKTAKDSAAADNLECTALCAAMKCIETHNLESQFPTEALTRRIIQLKKNLKRGGKKPISPNQSGTPPQQHTGNKRPSPCQPVHSDQQIRNKRHQPAFPKGASRDAHHVPPSYSANLTQQVHDSRAAAARDAPNADVGAPYDRILIPPTHIQSTQPYLSHQGMALSPGNLHHPLPVSAPGIHSSYAIASNEPTSIIDVCSTIRNQQLPPTDLYRPRSVPPQYADVSHHLLMNSLPTSRQQPFTSSVGETEGTSSTSGHYSLMGASRHIFSPTSHYGDGAAASARLFRQDELAGIHSDLAAVSAMKYGVVGSSSSTSHERSSPLASSAVPRSLHYLQQPYSYGYDHLSSQGQQYSYNP